MVECKIKNALNYLKRAGVIPGLRFLTWVPHSYTKPSVPVKSPTINKTNNHRSMLYQIMGFCLNVVSIGFGEIFTRNFKCKQV